MRPGFLDGMVAVNRRRWAALRPGSQAWDEVSGDLQLKEIVHLDTGRRRLEIEHADPHIRVAGELVELICRGEGAPEVQLLTCGWDGRWGPAVAPGPGDLLKITAANRRVVYRLVRYHPQWQAWEAEWPD